MFKVKSELSKEQSAVIVDQLPSVIGKNGMKSFNELILKYNINIAMARIYLLMTTKDEKYYAEVKNSDLIRIEGFQEIIFDTSHINETGTSSADHEMNMTLVGVGVLEGKEDELSITIDAIIEDLTKRFTSVNPADASKLKHEQYACALVGVLHGYKKELNMLLQFEKLEGILGLFS